MGTITLFFWGMAVGSIIITLIGWAFAARARNREAEVEVVRQLLESQRSVDRASAAVAAIDAAIARENHNART